MALVGGRAGKCSIRPQHIHDMMIKMMVQGGRLAGFIWAYMMYADMITLPGHAAFSAAIPGPVHGPYKPSPDVNPGALHAHPPGHSVQSRHPPASLHLYIHTVATVYQPLPCQNLPACLTLPACQNAPPPVHLLSQIQSGTGPPEALLHPQCSWGSPGCRAGGKAARAQRSGNAGAWHGGAGGTRSGGQGFTWAMPAALVCMCKDTTLYFPRLPCAEVRGPAVPPFLVSAPPPCPAMCRPPACCQLSTHAPTYLTIDTRSGPFFSSPVSSGALGAAAARTLKAREWRRPVDATAALLVTVQSCISTPQSDGSSDTWADRRRSASAFTACCCGPC